MKTTVLKRHLKGVKLFILFIEISLLQQINGIAQTCKEVIGYYPNWQWYDRNKLVNPETIDYSKYSILNYCFFSPQSDGTIESTDSWADENLLKGTIDWVNGGYIPNTSIVDLSHNNNVKIIPSIGGWTLSDNFPIIASNQQKRATFAQSCVNLIQTYNFDGIDIDWEYPGFAAHGGTAQDITNFTLLLNEVRAALNSYGNSVGKQFILSICISADPAKMDDIDWNAIDSSVDFINLMSYDLFGTWDYVTNHNAPLYAPAQGDTTFNIHSAVTRLVNHYNVSPNKLNVGLAFYGRSQTTNGTPGLFVAGTGSGDLSTFGTDQGTPLYYNIVNNLDLFDYNWDAQAKVPYLTGKNGLNSFVSYDDQRSIGLKAQYIVDHQLAGAIIWEITGDYLETSEGSGVISGTPLVDTLNAVFCNYVPDTTDNNTDTTNTNSDSTTTFIRNQIEKTPTIYPNPCKGQLYISNVSTAPFSVKISSLEGVLLFEKTYLQKGKITIDLSFLTGGTYLIQTTENQTIITQKFILIQ